MRPVRLRGSAQSVDAATGEVLGSFSTDGNPDGVLLVACGDRRAAVCPPCAERYRADTWHVVASGLRGGELAGEGPRAAALAHLPASVGDHPCLFVTLTAPSFGRVHTIGRDGTCRPRSGRPVCAHGTADYCNARHAADDRRLGEALCVECYDYTGHILWHTAAPELWRRFTIELLRSFSRLSLERTGVHRTVRALREELRASYVKVAEWQRRGAVHLHAVVRLDGIDPDSPETVTAPPSWADADLLAACVRDAAARVQVALPAPDGVERVARWGGQVDVRPITDPRRTAAYVAKYSVKTASDALPGLPVRRFDSFAVSRMRKRGVSWHLLMLAGTCLRLADAEGCEELRLAERVHTLGFPGHFATKSRRYSVTLGALRAVRRAWRAAQRKDDVWGQDGAVVVGDWRLVGIGHASPGDALLAEQLAREEATYREALKYHDVIRVRVVDDGEAAGVAA